MKAIVSFPKRTNWLKALGVLITCLLFLIPPSCEKPDPDQISVPVTDELVPTPRAANTATKMYWGPSDWWWSANSGQEISTPWYDKFESFVLKVQNVSNPEANISTLEIKIDGTVIITAKSLSRNYFALKSLRNLRDRAILHVFMEGTGECHVRIWVEATFKGLGTAYGKHLYYKAHEIQSLREWEFTPGINRFDMAREYCQQNGDGHLLIINDAKENTFVKSICKNGQLMMGLTDRWTNNPEQNTEQQWRWVNGSMNREVDWRSSCSYYPGYPDPNCIPWGDINCTIFTDNGFNNWDQGQPNNGGSRCDPGHVDENIAVFNSDGTWDDRAEEHIPWMSFVIEWDFIPSSDVIRNLFMREYPDYHYSW